MATKAQNYAARQANQRKYKSMPHTFNHKVHHWPYCSGCGLVALKNEQTRKQMSKPCESMED